LLDALAFGQLGAQLACARLDEPLEAPVAGHEEHERGDRPRPRAPRAREYTWLPIPRPGQSELLVHGDATRRAVRRPEPCSDGVVARTICQQLAPADELVRRDAERVMCGNRVTRSETICRFRRQTARPRVQMLARGDGRPELSVSRRGGRGEAHPQRSRTESDGCAVREEPVQDATQAGQTPIIRAPLSAACITLMSQ